MACVASSGAANAVEKDAVMLKGPVSAAICRQTPEEADMVGLNSSSWIRAAFSQDHKHCGHWG